jgi:autotransporter-associated beta strand protein
MKTKSSFICSWLVLILISECPFVGLGAKTPLHNPLPNFDHRVDRAPASESVSPEQQEAAGRLSAMVAGVRVDFDPVTGAAKKVGSSEGFLTSTNGTGGAVSAAAASRFAVDDPHRATKAFLSEHRKLFGHGPEVLESARIVREYVTPHNGMRTVVWEQQVDGVGVFEGILISHTTRRGELVNLCSQFLPDPTLSAERGTPNRAALMAAPPISARQAVWLAARNVGVEIVETDLSASGEPGSDAERRQKFVGPGLAGEAEAKLTWAPMNKQTLRLCWDVILMSQARGEMFRFLVDTRTGEVLLRRCLTSYLTDASYRVFTSDSPSPMSPGYPTPVTNQPPLVARVLVTLPALDTNASPAGWINDGDNQTLGNNVDAHTDWNADNIPDLPRPQGSPFRVFDFAMDLSSQDPTNYANAAVVQLFYLCNWYHDRLYQLGFTEAAGNFQTTNFNRGGLGNDAIQADAQDGSGTDNANFSTPPDGSPGRMQMYIFTGMSPRRDGDFDAEVVLHEATHGVSWRLVGGGQALGDTQSDGMGEGWSDFYALSLLSEAGDNVNGVYAAGAYASYKIGGPTDLQNYYFGIRRYPYTTDMSNNPLTFKDIDPAQADYCASGAPYHTAMFGACGASDASEVHNEGEVWCVTLWEARANLINKYGWATGNQLALQLVTDGMKLTPAHPNFLQARDAIIQADLVDTGGANHNELWAAFAKRGMGFSATSPDSSTVSGIHEAFDMPDDLRVSPLTTFTSSGVTGGPFTPVCQTYFLTNAGSNSIVWTTWSTQPWVSVDNPSGNLPAGASNVVDACIGGADSFPAGSYAATILFSNTVTHVVQTRDVSLLVTPAPATSMADSFDPVIDRAQWYSFSGTVLATNFGGAVSGPNSLWFGGDGERSATTRPIIATPGGNVSFCLRLANGSAYPWENVDLPDEGIVLEYSTNNGGAWTEFGRYDTTNYWAWTCVTVGIPISAQTPNTLFRWRQLSNSGASYDHWALDNVSITTGPQPPVVVAQPASQIVGVGGVANFSIIASGSAPLNYFWARNGSPIAGATNASYSTNGVQLSDSGTVFSCLVSNSYGTVTSSNALLTVVTLPTDYFTELFATGNITNLAFRTYTFTPDGSANFYSVCSQVAAKFPTDPAGGTTLSLSDDSYAQITLSGGSRVSIYTNQSGVLYVGSNGYLTLGAGDTTFSPSYASHFNLPRVSALFGDLNPGNGGMVSWKQMADRVAVTYQGVPVFGSANQTNSFQIEMFFDGRIQITFLQLNVPSGLVGLSAGVGQPGNFVASDFTAYIACGPQAPVITAQPVNQTVTVSGSATFSVNAGGTGPLSYFWKRNGSFIAGANGPTYTTNNVQLTDSGTPFSCLVSNSLGTVDSSPATLYVVPPAFLTWDANTSLGGAQDGNGSWGASSDNTNWWNGMVNVAWDNTRADIAVLGVNTATAETITLSNNVVVGGIIYSNAGPAAYTIIATNGAGLTINGPSPVIQLSCASNVNNIITAAISAPNGLNIRSTFKNAPSLTWRGNAAGGYNIVGTFSVGTPGSDSYTTPTSEWVDFNLNADVPTAPLGVWLTNVVVYSNATFRISSRVNVSNYTLLSPQQITISGDGRNGTNGAWLITAPGGGAGSTAISNVVLAGDSTIMDSYGQANATYIIPGVISGVGRLRISGDASLSPRRYFTNVLTGGPHTYAGNTHVCGGATVRLMGGNDRLPANTILSLGLSGSPASAWNDYGQLVLGTANGAINQTLVGLTSDPNTPGCSVAGGNSATSSVLTINNPGDNVFAGMLGGPTTPANMLTLIKRGQGRLTLSGANAYAGGTTLIAGTLEGSVSGSIPGNVTNTGGTLKLDTSAVMSSSATLALASSPSAGAVNLNFSGVQTINSLYFGTTRKAAGTWSAAGATHNNAAFAGSGQINVSAGPSSTTVVGITSGSATSIYGSPLTFTASVAGNSPGGTVQFSVDGATVGIPPAILTAGSASWTIAMLPVSSNPHQVTATYGGDDNNNPSSAANPLMITVNPAPLVVSASSATRQYGETNPVFSGFIIGLTNNDNITAIYVCTAIPSSPPGTYPITIILSDPNNRLPNYSVSTNLGMLTVSCPPITVTPAALPAAMVGCTYNQILGASGGAAPCTFAVTSGALPEGFLLATNGVLSGIAATAGTNEFVITATDSNGCSGSHAYIMSATEAPPAITSQPLSATNFAATTARFSVTATGTPELRYQWRLNGTDLTNDSRITGSQTNSLTISNVLVGDAGNYQVLVTNNYGSVTSSAAAFVVLPAIPAVTWTNPAEIKYGMALSGSQLNASADVSGDFVYTPAAGAVPDAGVARLSAVFIPTDTTNYVSVTNNISLLVLPAPLSVTANSSTRFYGEINPPFAGNILGITNNDNILVTFECNATTNSPPGNYLIVPRLTDPETRLGNYVVTTNNGTLTVILPGQFLSVSQSGANLSLTWSTISGRIYQLQYRSSLTGGDWINLGGPITAAENTASASDTITNMQRFYRVVQLP